MRPHIPRLAVAVLLSTLAAVSAAQAQHHGHKIDRVAKTPACSEPTLKCASTVTPAFGPDGTLWVAFAAAQRVLVARSRDGGRNFEPAVEVTPGPQQLDWGPDSRPKIVVDAKGRITVAYATFKDKAFNGQVFVSHAQEGHTFTPPRPITENNESQRFEALGLDPEGRLFAAWLDKRNRPAARARGESYAGAALAYTWLSETAPAESSVALALDNTCECCRLGLAFAGPGKPVLMFRNIFQGSIRDHAILAFASPTTMQPLIRVSDDGWKTDACPHHGPQLAISEAGTYHAVWFTNGSNRQGLFYARAAGGEGFSPPLALGRPDKAPARPAVLAHKSRVFLAWKEFDGHNSLLFVKRSADDGQTWSAPAEVARTQGDNDHPLFVANGAHVFISWKSQGPEGYRLIELDQLP